MSQPLFDQSFLKLLLEDWQQLLTQWARNGALSRAAREALRLSEEPEDLRRLVKRWGGADFQDLPPVVVVPSSSMPNAVGAYAISTSSIYLNQEWLQDASRDWVFAVLTEELGHHLDGLLNSSDSPGDEGELFAALARGAALSQGQLQRIQTEEDLTIAWTEGTAIEIEQSAYSLANLYNPVGICLDDQDNIVTASENENASMLLFSKLSQGGSILQQLKYRINTTGLDLGHFSTVTTGDEILQLQPDGDLMVVDAATLSMSLYANLKQILSDTSSIVDISSGRIGNLGGLIDPRAENTIYGDIAILERGNQMDIFISGLSMGTFPFVMRLRLLSGSLESAKVLVASVGSTAGDVNLTRGVAVNKQGIVLTTLPIATGKTRPQFIDVYVSFGADFPETDEEWPQERLQGKGIDFSDESNHLYIASQGMTTDSSGNFYVVTNSIGAPGLNAPGRGTFVVLSSDLNSVLDVQTSTSQGLTSYRDVAVNSTRDQAFITSSEGMILGVPISISNTTFEITATSTSAQIEGNSGTTDFRFTVTRKGSLTGTNAITVLLNGAGVNPANALDFFGESSLPQSSILTVTPNEIAKDIYVVVTGDAITEQNEIFSVEISNPTNGASITLAKAMGTIINDDIKMNNDNFSDRIQLTGRNASVTGSNVGFTSEPGEPPQRGTITSAWWSWTPPQSSLVTIDTNRSNFDTYLSVFTGNSIDSLVVIAQDDDAGNDPDTASQVTFAATAGTTYQISVDGYGNESGAITLNINQTPSLASSFSIVSTNATAIEGTGDKTPFTFIITRTGSLSTAAEVTAIVSGTGSNPAEISDFGEGQNVRLPSQTVSFNPNQTSSVVSIDIWGDNYFETDETFLVSLSNPSNGATIGTATAMGTIINDDLSNRSPTNLDLSKSSVAENSDDEVIIGTFTAMDPDVNDSFSYRLVSGTGSDDNALFSIHDKHLKANSSFDFETKNSYTIRVRVTDKEGLFYERAFSISVTDVNENLMGEIRGLKWNDLNGNGIPETGESGLEGMTIFLDGNKNGILDPTEISATTNASGQYAFTKLAAATYTVCELLPFGWQQTYPSSIQNQPFRLLSCTNYDGTNAYSLLELQYNPVSETLIRHPFYSIGVDVNPLNKDIYAGMISLNRVSTVDGSYVRVGSINSKNGNVFFKSFAFSPEGILYAYSIDYKLYTIDETKAYATEIGSVSSEIECIDFGPDGTLYAASSNLYKLDRATGKILATIGVIGPTLTDIDFAPDGFIYGVDSSTQSLYRSNPLNASTDFLAKYSSKISGIASTPFDLATPSKSHAVTLEAGQVVTEINFGNRKNTPVSDDPSITFVIAPSTGITEDGRENLVYTFSRTGPTTSALTVNYTVTGSATLGTDYTGIAATPDTKSITFAAGSPNATITINPTEDTSIEPDETVALTLASGSGYTIGTVGTVIGTIKNDDPSITLAVAPTAGITEDGKAKLIYTFSRTGSTTSTLKVYYSVAGSASRGKDYTGIAATPTNKSVTFAAGTSKTVVTVDPTADFIAETNETVSLQLRAGSGYSIGTTKAVTGTILNDDIIGTAASNSLSGTPGPDYIDGLAGADTLSGQAGADRFGFRFTHSPVRGPDRITDFAFGSDRITLLSATGSPLPLLTSLSRAADNPSAATLLQLATSVFTDANGVRVGNQPLAANAAALVRATHPAIAGTYLLINNSAAALSMSNDLLINLTGHSGTLPALGSSPASRIFV